MADETEMVEREQVEPTDAEPTPEQLREENARLKASKAALEADLVKRREADKTRKAAEAAEARRRQEAGLSEPEKIAERLRQSESEKEQAERLLADEKQGRVNDYNERSILIAAPKHLNADHVDLAWDKIDRTLLTFDDNGKVTGGIDKALEKLAKDRPTWGIAKPRDYGTGPRRNDGNNNQSTNFFLDPQKTGIVNPL